MKCLMRWGWIHYPMVSGFYSNKTVWIPFDISHNSIPQYNCRNIEIPIIQSREHFIDCFAERNITGHILTTIIRLLTVVYIGVDCFCLVVDPSVSTQSPYKDGLTLIPTWMRYYTIYKVWYEITYLFPNFKRYNHWSLGMDKQFL